ncbi:MAG: hypothetical protein EZS28_032916 [Streblomastix strix]|uniref:Uncharacterized protein n=1 Tax=Streblomastix strix TaxID=222440 RepID=A0A5J4UM25_9EUKA|nr:MAG: hypothetical protein EZS28_032916 [Streblomastix strix]
MESFDQSLCAQLSSQFKECKTKAEQNLLAVVEALAKCAAEQYLKDSSSNFILTIASSNLPKVIENGLNARIKSADEEEEDDDDLDWMHDDVSLQLSRIFCYLTNISFFNHKIVFHSGLVIKFYIGCLVSYMNKLCKEATNIQKKNIKESNEYENVKKSIRLQIEELSDYLIAVKFGTNYQRKRIEFANVVDMNEEIEPLFHINCPSSLKCSRKIAFPESINTELLHLQALEVLSQFEETMNKPKLYSVDSDNIVAHLAPIIIYFAAKTPYWRNYSLTNKLQLLSLDMNDSAHSEQQFHIFLTLLHNIMVHNNRLASSVASYSNLLPILI